MMLLGLSSWLTQIHPFVILTYLEGNAILIQKNQTHYFQVSKLIYEKDWLDHIRLPDTTGSAGPINEPGLGTGA